MSNSNGNDLEEFLMSNNFYSAPTSSPSSHVNTLRNSIQIKHSPSLTSISSKVVAPGPIPPSEKTSFMKISPSMKALESILNERSQASSTPPNLSHSLSSQDFIEEEEEPEEEEEEQDQKEDQKTQQPAPSFPYQNDFAPPNIPVFQSNNPFSEHRKSDYSMQSFETARSHNSSPDPEQQQPLHGNKRSISTIDEVGYSTDETPVLAQGATFHDYKQGLDKPQIKAVGTPSSREVSSGSTINGSVANGKVKNRVGSRMSDQDDTLIDEKPDNSEVTADNSYRSESTVRNSSLNEKKDQSDIKQSSKVLPETPSTPSTPPRQPKPLMMRASASSPQLSYPKESHNYPLSRPLVSTEKRSIQQHPTPQKPVVSMLSGAGKPTEKKPSQATAAKSPGSRHKRSSTLGDLSQVEVDLGKSIPRVPEKKKFSFKALFKSKSKNHSLDDVGKSKKMASKSYSTSNLNSYRDPVEDKKEETSSLFNVFKKNKSSDTLNKLGRESKEMERKTPKHTPKHTPTQAPVEQFTTTDANNNAITNTNNSNQPTNRSNRLSYYPLKVDSTLESSQNLDKKPFKSNTNINFIREVTDDDYVPAQTPKIPVEDELPAPEVAEQDDEYYNQYDSNNLLNYPPKKMTNARYDEEMSLISSPVKEEITVSFGSPFEVQYNQPHEEIPRRESSLAVPASSSELSNATEPLSPKSVNEKQEQLLGEALFPRSLNPQEVEDIVSLERSRSIKSIKSAKRNSFVNYTGSDDNIIQYSGPPPSSPPAKTGITRSNSILKNSNSRRNLNEALYTSIDSKVNEHDNKKEQNGNYDVFNSTMDSTDKSPGNTADEPAKVPETAKETAISAVPANADTTDFDHLDFIEFTDFIDVDNLSFSNSPEQKTEAREEVPPVSEFSLPPSVTVSSPVSPVEEKEKTIPSEPVVSKGVSQAASQPMVSPSMPITPAASADEPIEVGSESSSEYTFNQSIIETSPILESAFRTSNSPSLNRDGKSTFNNRPISMSFRGLKGPSFAGKISQHNLRSSDSHQSFNLSFGEDSDVGSGVGGGFGSSDEEDNLSDLASDSDISHIGIEKHKQRTKTNYQKDDLPAPPKSPFRHSRGHSSDSNTSNSSSFSSKITRKWKKSPKVPVSLPSSAFTVGDKGGGVRFSSRIILYDTYNGDEYDRHPDTATCNQLTPILAQQIKDELNSFKSEMSIHADSRCYTHFF